MARRIELRRTARPLKRAASREDICRNKFLRHFPGGFYGEKYLDWERAYKVEAHQYWLAELDRFQRSSPVEIAQRAVRIEGRTNLLFSFEKMALRDAVKSPAGARDFAIGLKELLYSRGSMRQRFTRWIHAVAALPLRQTRVLTWPIVTVFGFIAQPDRHIFLKPNVTKRAAKKYGFDFEYHSKPSWDTYASLLAFAERIAHDLRDLKPRDMIDIQSFIWVMGSDEYP